MVGGVVDVAAVRAPGGTCNEPCSAAVQCVTVTFIGFKLNYNLHSTPGARTRDSVCVVVQLEGVTLPVLSAQRDDFQWQVYLRQRTTRSTKKRAT